MGGARADQLVFRELGAGDPVVVINGYSGTNEERNPTFLGGLGTRSRLICPDNRGMGASPPVFDGLTVADMANDVVALIETLELGRCDLVGWSMGGFVVQKIAARVPARVGRIVLLATDPGGPKAVTSDPETWARLTDHSGSPREQASRIIRLLFPPGLAGALPGSRREHLAGGGHALMAQEPQQLAALIDAWSGRCAACAICTSGGVNSQGFGQRADARRKKAEESIATGKPPGKIMATGGARWISNSRSRSPRSEDLLSRTRS